MKGELYKRSDGMFKKWDARYFVINDGSLEYYKNAAGAQKKKNPRLCIPLKNAWVDLVNEKEVNRNFCFAITPAFAVSGKKASKKSSKESIRTYYMAASDKKSLEAWFCEICLSGAHTPVDISGFERSKQKKKSMMRAIQTNRGDDSYRMDVEVDLNDNEAQFTMVHPNHSTVSDLMEFMDADDDFEHSSKVTSMFHVDTGVPMTGRQPDSSKTPPPIVPSLELNPILPGKSRKKKKTVKKKKKSMINVKHNEDVARMYRSKSMNDVKRKQLKLVKEEPTIQEENEDELKSGKSNRASGKKKRKIRRKKRKDGEVRKKKTKSKSKRSLQKEQKKNENEQAAMKNDREGQELYKNGRPEKAIVAYTKAIGILPTYADFYLHRAEAFRALEMRPEAEADLEKYEEIFNLDVKNKKDDETSRGDVPELMTAERTSAYQMDKKNEMAAALEAKKRLAKMKTRAATLPKLNFETMAVQRPKKSIVYHSSDEEDDDDEFTSDDDGGDYYSDDSDYESSDENLEEKKSILKNSTPSKNEKSDDDDEDLDFTKFSSRPEDISPKNDSSTEEDLDFTKFSSRPEDIEKVKDKPKKTVTKKKKRIIKKKIELAPPPPPVPDDSDELTPPPPMDSDDDLNPPPPGTDSDNDASPPPPVDEPKKTTPRRKNASTKVSTNKKKKKPSENIQRYGTWSGNKNKNVTKTNLDISKPNVVSDDDTEWLDSGRVNQNKSFSKIFVPDSDMDMPSEPTNTNKQIKNSEKPVIKTTPIEHTESKSVTKSKPSPIDKKQSKPSPINKKQSSNKNSKFSSFGLDGDGIDINDSFASKKFSKFCSTDEFSKHVTPEQQAELALIGISDELEEQLAIDEDVISTARGKSKGDEEEEDSNNDEEDSNNDDTDIDTKDVTDEPKKTRIVVDALEINDVDIEISPLQPQSTRKTGVYSKFGTSVSREASIEEIDKDETDATDILPSGFQDELDLDALEMDDELAALALELRAEMAALEEEEAAYNAWKTEHPNEEYNGVNEDDNDSNDDDDDDNDNEKNDVQDQLAVEPVPVSINDNGLNTPRSDSLGGETTDDLVLQMEAAQRELEEEVKQLEMEKVEQETLLVANETNALQEQNKKIEQKRILEQEAKEAKRLEAEKVKQNEVKAEEERIAKENAEKLKKEEEKKARLKAKEEEKKARLKAKEEEKKARLKAKEEERKAVLKAKEEKMSNQKLAEEVAKKRAAELFSKKTHSISNDDSDSDDDDNGSSLLEKMKSIQQQYEQKNSPINTADSSPKETNIITIKDQTDESNKDDINSKISTKDSEENDKTNDDKEIEKSSNTILIDSSDAQQIQSTSVQDDKSTVSVSESTDSEASPNRTEGETFGVCVPLRKYSNASSVASENSPNIEGNSLTPNKQPTIRKVVSSRTKPVSEKKKNSPGKLTDRPSTTAGTTTKKQSTKSTTNSSPSGKSTNASIKKRSPGKLTDRPKTNVNTESKKVAGKLTDRTALTSKKRSPSSKLTDRPSARNTGRATNREGKRKKIYQQMIDIGLIGMKCFAYQKEWFVANRKGVSIEDTTQVSEDMEVSFRVVPGLSVKHSISFQSSKNDKAYLTVRGNQVVLDEPKDPKEATWKVRAPFLKECHGEGMWIALENMGTTGTFLLSDKKRLIVQAPEKTAVFERFATFTPLADFPKK